MKRREFIAGLGSVAAWPVVAWAQQPARMRRIGVLIGGNENDPQWKPRLSAFMQALADLGWTDGRNVRMDVRWYGDGINRIRALAQELVGLQPDIILAGGPAAAVPVQRETRTIRSSLQSWATRSPEASSLCRTVVLRQAIARKSYFWRRKTTYRRSIRMLSLPGTAGYFPTDPIE